MLRQLLIAGIDPGTTTGYAFLDLHDNIIYSGYKRHIGIDKLISESLKYGKIIMVCSDKKKIPLHVERFAIKLGARLIRPDHDLGVREKKELLTGLDIKNSHESDALASALFGLKQLKSLIKKIDLFIERNKKESISDDLFELVVKEEIGIQPASLIIEMEKKVKGEEKKIPKLAEVSREIKFEDFMKIYSNLKSKEKETEILKRVNRKLQQELNVMKKENEKIKQKLAFPDYGNKVNRILQHKEINIQQLNKIIKEKEQNLLIQKKRIDKISGFLNELNSSIVVKRLSDLSLNEYDSCNKVMKIKEGDILLVDNPGIYSDKTLELSKGKVDVIITKKEISKKLKDKMPFVFIDASKLTIKEEEHFALIDKKEFAVVKSKAAVIDNIVSDYKKERTKSSS